MLVKLVKLIFDKPIEALSVGSYPFKRECPKFPVIDVMCLI